MDQRNSKFEPASSGCATKRSKTIISVFRTVWQLFHLIIWQDAWYLAFGILHLACPSVYLVVLAVRPLLFFFNHRRVAILTTSYGGNDYEKRTITTNVKKGYLIYISLNSNLRPESWMIYFRRTRRATGTWCTEWGFPLIFVIEWASLSEVPLSRWRLRPTLYFICLKPEDSPAGQQAVFMLIKDIEYGHIKRQMPLFVTTSGVLPTARHLPFCTYALP